MLWAGRVDYNPTFSLCTYCFSGQFLFLYLKLRQTLRLFDLTRWQQQAGFLSVCLTVAVSHFLACEYLQHCRRAMSPESLATAAIFSLATLPICLAI